MDMKSVLLDLVKHTAGLGIIENIKINSTDGTTRLAAMDPNKTVILTASLHDEVKEFAGEFGMGNLGLLNSLTKLSNYQVADAKITVERRERNGIEVPTNLVFQDGEGNKDQYRFMSKELVDLAMKTPIYKGATWDVAIEPAAKRIAQLAEVANIYASIDPSFKAKTEKGDLVFEVGNAEGGVIGRRVFAENIKGELSPSWSWPLQAFLSILKLGGTTVVRFSNQGACQIDVDSGIGIYSYIILANSR